MKTFAKHDAGEIELDPGGWTGTCGLCNARCLYIGTVTQGRWVHTYELKRDEPLPEHPTFGFFPGTTTPRRGECPNCHRPYHTGMTCAEWTAHLNENEKKMNRSHVDHRGDDRLHPALEEALFANADPSLEAEQTAIYREIVQ